MMADRYTFAFTMLRQVIAFVFLVAFALQTFSSAIVVLDYVANTKAYASKCENKARPGMHCNGKCQMMKKLKQEEKKDQQNPERKAENKNELIFGFQTYSPNIVFFEVASKQLYSILQCGKEIKIPQSVFHPPALA